MKKIIFTITVFLLTCGCESLRFAPNEAQKQNAWLHHRTETITAETARAENTSDRLQALSRLGELQSRAFVSYFGLPQQYPQAETAEDVLAESNRQLAETALQSGAARPDGWQVADAALELGIGICALFGGVTGTQAMRFLKNARTKSKALQEIIAGTELFKQQNTESAAAFKQAHNNQSPETRQLVTQMKTAS
jgi:hypothetical protein